MSEKPLLGTAPSATCERDFVYDPDTPHAETPEKQRFGERRTPVLLAGGPCEVSMTTPPTGRRIVRITCIVCDAHAARLELIPPGWLPAGWEGWDALQRVKFLNRRDRRSWWLIYEGLLIRNWPGQNVSVRDASKFAHAFSPPYRYERIRGAGIKDHAGFCGECGVPYCAKHWDLTTDGHGRCPHGHRLVPHDPSDDVS
jgi:hypothetical protein